MSKTSNRGSHRSGDMIPDGLPSAERAINALYGFDAGAAENLLIALAANRLKAARTRKSTKPPKKTQWCRTAGV